MTKNSKATQDTIHEVMEEFKLGKLKSGRGGTKVTDSNQAIAIGLSKSRKKGLKAPEH